MSDDEGGVFDAYGLKLATYDDEATYDFHSTGVTEALFRGWDGGDEAGKNTGLFDFGFNRGGG